MGTRGKGIIGKDADKIVKALNKAYADEWLAYYMYWLGAKIVAGPMKDAAITELMEHANDELRHADMVAERIIKLGGTPVTSPEKWYDFTNCGYEEPNDPYIRQIIEQNIKGEQCAIDVYNDLMNLTQGKDYITHNMSLEILQDEVDHEEDLEGLLEDLDMITSRESQQARG